MQTLNNKKQIGIPRAISYYNNFAFYYGFFKALGIDVVISDKTTSKIINEGSKYLVSDTCLPIKVFVGHVLNLLDKGCNTILIPSIQSTAYKINNCSKIRGLPEIIRNVIKIPFKMIEPTLDITNKITLNDFCFYIAEQYEITNKEVVKKAMNCGFEMYNNFLEMCRREIPFNEAMQNAIKGQFENKIIEDIKPLSVVVMSHGYNLFDEKISMNLLKKLDKLDVKTYTGLNITREQAVKSIDEIGEIQYWANELDLTGTAAYYILNKKIDGIIALSAFGCGPDSLMVEEISYHAKEAGIPIIHINIDEHTGEAGFMTRIEAFVDMLIRKKRKFLNSEDSIYNSTNQIVETIKNSERELVNSLA